MSISFKSPVDIMELLAQRFSKRRLDMNLTQKTLSTRSGVSYGSLKKFEQTGQISLHSLLKLAWALGVLTDFEKLLLEPPTRLPISLAQVLQKQEKRKRGRE